MSALLREVLFAPPTVLQPRPPTLLFPFRWSGYVRWCESDAQAVQADWVGHWLWGGGATNISCQVTFCLNVT